jgi:hypothetical protein
MDVKIIKTGIWISLLPKIGNLDGKD